MKKNLLLKLSSVALMMAATGCLKEEEVAEVPADPTVATEDPRAALVQALDTQATQLVDGINKVIISGKFVQNMSVQNPPQPIPLGNDNDVQKAIRYLLSNQTTQGATTTYKPDPRFCSELVAKNDPTICIQLLEEVTIKQTTADSTTGIVEFSVADAKPFLLTYSPSAIGVTTQFSEIIQVLKEVSRLEVQNGGPGFANTIPSVHQGALTIALSNSMAMSILDFSITQAINLGGQDGAGRPYSFTAAVAQHAATIVFNSALSMAYVTLNVPAVSVNMTAHDDQNGIHSLEVQFPGLSGSLNLDNALEMIAVQALKLTTPDAYINIDGQSAIHGIFNDEVHAELKSSQGGNLTLSFLQQFSAQVDVTANALIPSTGTISALVAQNTQIYFPHNSEQAKVLQGALQLTGTQDFTGSMDAQANSCIEGGPNSPLFLETVVCPF